MPLSLSLMFWHLSLVNIVILLVCVSLFPCFLMTELNMDNHCPWILWIKPLLHLDRYIHFSPGKTHPCCSHSLFCIFTIFSSPLHLCIEIILMSWLKFQMEATRICFWVWWHLILLLQCQWSTEILSVLRGRCSYMCIGPELVSSHH